jgi:glycosyltransferase involved in cell wall biosynthesis
VSAALPKIAHVDTERGFSGGEVQVFLLIEGLRRQGWRNVLFSPPGSRVEARARDLGVEHVAVAMRNDLDVAAIVAMQRGFRATGAALAHLHTGRATWLGGLAARFAGVPAITTRRMDREVRTGLRTKLIYGTLTRRAVAISPAVADCLRRGGVHGSRVRTIWSAIDPEALRPRRTREETRRDLGARPDQVVLISIGTLVPRKGLDVLMDALATLPDRGTWGAWLAGDGAERENLERRATELGVASNVRFLGRRDDVADLLAACDVVAMPSRREGLGVAALEAMAAGRAIVASNVGGLGQAVLHERTGLLVPPGDARALAAALRSLIEDRSRRERLGAAGPARIAEGFLASQMVEAYAQLYREVLAEVAR